MFNLTKILVMLSLILSSTIPAIASQDTVDASPYSAQVDNSQFNDYDTELTPEEIAKYKIELINVPFGLDFERRMASCTNSSNVKCTCCL